MSLSFPDNVYPPGEFLQSSAMHGSKTEIEIEELDMQYYSRLNDLRKAAEVHRRVIFLFKSL